MHLRHFAFGRQRGGRNVLGCRAGGKLLAQIGCGQLLRRHPGQEFCHEGRLGLIGRSGRGGPREDLLAVTRFDVGGRGRAAGRALGVGKAQHAHRSRIASYGNDENTHALAPGTTGAARPVQKRVGVRRHVGMDHEVEVRQVDAACRHVGCNTHAGTAVTHRLKRIRSLGLGQFSGERHHMEPAVAKLGRQVLYRFARVAEHDGAAAIKKQQRIDDGVLTLMRLHKDELIVDVGMALPRARGHDAHRIPLVCLRQLGNLLGNCR